MSDSATAGRSSGQGGLPGSKRGQILEVAAVILCKNRYEDVSLEQVRQATGLTEDHFQAEFASMREIAEAILDLERASMKFAQQVGEDAGVAGPLEALRAAFRVVGRNIESRPAVRAGIRIASESREAFPNRRLDPFLTWRSFVVKQLEAAARQSLIHPSTDVDRAAWLLVSAGLGTKELVRFCGEWDRMSERLDDTVDCVLNLMGYSVSDR
ncbi:hypothetical protein [Paenarthrobacter sp. NPDC091669]|jgi:AcrR family transcriptional regulator|uniref:hypothetical protein n=1 Tax=Paenarthrobacter sp. NPDC091669 TaxID=3364384 RepID=UPI0038094AEE